MSNPDVEARLAALESQMGWRRNLPAWLMMKDAPMDRDILLTVQQANGTKVCIGWWQDAYGGRWRTSSGQVISKGCALAWMDLPQPSRT